MKKLIITIALAGITNIIFAQSIDSLQTLAHTQMQASDFDNACKTLALALQSSPNNLDLLKDQLFATMLKRDFGTSIQLGEDLIKRPDADVQCYQLLGSTYKQLAEYKEGDKVYKAGLKKFPTSGVLYGEYGDLLIQNNQGSEAIAILEKGIKADVNNNGNYYYAAKYYISSSNTDNLLQGLLYGEIFVNIESYTPRTDEIKKLLLQGYKKLFTGKILAKTASDGKGFINTVATILSKDAPAKKDGITLEDIAEARWKFILDWQTSPNMATYPYRLFDMYRQLVNAKIFDAYNQWLLGAADNADKYQQWQTDHAAAMEQWEQMLHNIVFKIPAGQYYGN